MEVPFEAYVGSACEIENEHNDLLLHGRVSAVSHAAGCTVEVTSLDGGPLLQCEPETQVKLRLFSNTDGSLFANGRVAETGASRWKIAEVTPVSQEERRSFFRVKIANNARVHAINGATVPAYALSVSLSGVMFCAKTEFKIDQEVTVSDMCLGRDMIPFNVPCRVVRIGETTEAGTQYGCLFLHMAQAESDRMCRDIFELQRQAVRSRRPLNI